MSAPYILIVDDSHTVRAFVSRALTKEGYVVGTATDGIDGLKKMAERLPDMIDFDTGAIIRGDATTDDLADRLLDLTVETASGRYQTRAQLLGQDDFLPWKRGVSL